MNQQVNRIIGKLDIKNGYVVKGIMMEGVQRIGNPVTMAEKYYNEDIDELILLDTVASLYQRNELPNFISKIIKETFVPICAGGGISSIADAKKLISCGADKICLNTSATKDPSLISELASQLGSSSIVAQIDVKLYKGDYHVFVNSGRDATNYLLKDWLEIVYERGAGEILITSIDMDGREVGIEKTLCNFVDLNSKLPVIYGGGISTNQHVEEIFLYQNITGVALASALHFDKLQIGGIKKSLAKNGINVRYDEYTESWNC